MDFKFSEDNFFQVINLMSVNSEISKKKIKILLMMETGDFIDINQHTCYK